MRQTLMAQISKNLNDFFYKLSPIRKGIFHNLTRRIYSPVLSAALIQNLIKPEDSLVFILAEENYQLRKWPRLKHIHSAKEEEILFNIYYHLFSNSLIDGCENAHS